MKKRIALLLVLVLLLAGCSTPGGTTQGTTMGTVPDLFTQPTTVPQATTKPAETGPTLPDRDIPDYGGMGFDDRELVYEGSEVHTTIMVIGRGYENVGLGLLLFVDGQPQPYRMAEDGGISYMHTVYPEDMVEYHYDMLFTPVSGEVGETVDVHIMGFSDPTYCIGDGEWGAHFTFVAANASITFNAAPAAQELPEVTDALVDWSCAYVEATDEEMGQMTPEQLEQEIRFTYNLNDMEREHRVYGAAEGDTAKFHLEVWGMPYAEFGLVLFVDGTPVSVNSEDMMLFDIKNGQKTVIDAEFTLTGFDGSCNVCAVLVPRNARSCGVENKLWLEDIEVFYFVSAASYGDLLVQINQ